MAKLKYDSAAHRAKVAEYRRLVDSGKGWCCEVICLVEQDGGTRWIPPRSPMDAAHDRTDPSGQSYLGPAHRRCNRAEGARFKHQRDAQRAAAPIKRRSLSGGSNVPTGSNVPAEGPSAFLEATGSHCRPGMGSIYPDFPHPTDEPGWHESATGERRVVLVVGPPGAGKSTFAQSLDLPVFDLDTWPGSAKGFRSALAGLKNSPSARAVVIRTDPYSDAATSCGATELVVLDTPLDECVKRIRVRGRATPPIRSQIAAAQQWWRTYEKHGRKVPRIGETKRRAL